MFWLLRILHGATLLGLLGAAGLFAFEVADQRFMRGSVWSLALFWSSITLAGVHLCVLAARARKLPILMWASAPIGGFTIALIVLLCVDFEGGLRANAGVYAQWAGTGCLIVWALASIGSMHRVFMPGRRLVLIRLGADGLVVIALLFALMLVWWWEINQRILDRPGFRIDETFDDAARFTGASVLIAAVVCLILIVLAKRHELTGETEPLTAYRLEFSAVCPRCGTRSSLRTGGDACRQCHLRITVKSA